MSRRGRGVRDERGAAALEVAGVAPLVIFGALVALQFGVAVWLFGEPFTRWHAIAFPMIWAALALYSFETWRRSRPASPPP